MVDSPSLPLAFAAGAVSFVSPCCLPLVPGYLATVSGATPKDLERKRLDPRVLVRSLLFVSSFSILFIALGLGATALGSLLFDNKPLLDKIAGLAILAMGALLISSVFVTRLNRQFRVPGLIERAGRGGPVVAGAAFALAWTPCVGPTLGAILSAAALSNSEAHGALLLGFYSAGLAVPFLFTSLAFTRMTLMFGYIKRHFGAIVFVGGAVLIAMGVLVWTGELFRLNIEAQNFLRGTGLDFFNSV